MFKKLFILSLTMVFSSFFLSAEESTLPKPKIAVIDFQSIGDINNNAQLGIAVAENLRTSLIVSKQYQVIERSALEKIMEEQKLQLTGIVDQSKAIELGKLAGAEKIVMGSITKIGDTYTLNVRFIDVTTSVASTAKKIEGKSQNDIPYMIDETVRALVSTETVEQVSKQDEPSATPNVKSSRSSMQSESPDYLSFIKKLNLKYGIKIGYANLQYETVETYNLYESSYYYYYYPAYRNTTLQSKGIIFGGSANYKFTDSLSLQPELYITGAARHFLDLPILISWNCYNFNDIHSNILAGPDFSIGFDIQSSLNLTVGTSLEYKNFVLDLRYKALNLICGQDFKTANVSLGYLF